MKLKRSLQITPLALLVLSLSLWITASGGVASEVDDLGEPPVFPETLASSPAIQVGEYTLYLPVLHCPPPPPQWVDTQDRQASQALYKVEYLQFDGSDIAWKGSHDACDAGDISDAYRNNELHRLNYFRSMAGVPALVGLYPTYNAKAQAAALMMSVNEMLSHDPDPSWRCYSQAGDEGAGSSNLYLGRYGPDAMSGYVYDPGDKNYPVGHRRWILYPPTQYMGTGDIPPTDYSPSNALFVIDSEHWGTRPKTRDPFVAWPPPGYVPYQVVYPRWSFSYPSADFSQATVAMTRAGKPLAVQLLTVKNGYGDNTLVWEPQEDFGGSPDADTPYQVTVSNARINDQLQSFSYTVMIFDPE
jgi:hypothetical protein